MGQATQCVFEAQGTSRTGSFYTGPMSMSLSDCQNACVADSICLAFTHNSKWNTCSHHDSTETISTGCTFCTYYLKFCAPMTSMFTFLCHIIFQQLPFFWCCWFFSILYISSDVYSNVVHVNVIRISVTYEYALPNEPSYDIIHPLFSATLDIGEITSTPVPGSCAFLSHGTNTKGSTHYRFTSESFSDCQSRCLLDTRCNGFTHNSRENNCRLHETSESQYAAECDSCTFVSKSCLPSISEYEPPLYCWDTTDTA